MTKDLTTSANDLLDQAERLAAGGDYAAALVLLDTLGPDPQSDPVRCGLLKGRIHAQQGHLPEAVEAFQAVLHHEPGNQEAKEPMELAMQLNKMPSSNFLLKANAYIIGQFAVITLLLLVVLILAFRSPEDMVAERTQALLKSQEQQQQVSLSQMEMVLQQSQQSVNQVKDALNARLERLELNQNSAEQDATSAMQRLGTMLGDLEDRLEALNQQRQQDLAKLETLVEQQGQVIGTRMGSIMDGTAVAAERTAQSIDGLGNLLSEALDRLSAEKQELHELIVPLRQDFLNLVERVTNLETATQPTPSMEPVATDKSAASGPGTEADIDKPVVPVPVADQPKMDQSEPPVTAAPTATKFEVQPVSER